MLEKLFKGKNILIVSIIIGIAALVVFIITPTGITEPESEEISRIYLADNISIAHERLIEEFNRRQFNI